MKISFLIVFCLYIVGFADNISVQSLTLTQAEKQYINEKKAIIVHNEATWAPYNFNENGIPKGFSIDYINLVAKKVGLDVKYLSGYSWNQYLELIKTDKLDVIINIAKTQKRAKYIDFTTPFISSKKAIFSNTKGLKSLKDLNGKIVAVPKKFFIYEYLQKKYPKIILKPYQNIKECLYAIINNEADALVENYAVVNYQIRKNGLVIKYITISDDKELMTNLSLGISKEQPILKDILQKGQNSVTKQELGRLDTKWFGLVNELVKPYIYKDGTKNKTSNIRTNHNINLTSNEKQYLEDKKFIKMCVDPNWIPFEKIDKNGQYVGIISDYAKLFSKKLNIDFVLEKTKNYQESLNYLKQNRCDIIMAEVATKDKRKDFLYTKPYFTSPRAYVTHDDTPWVNDFAYFVKRHYTVGVLKNAPAFTILKERYKDINLVEFDTTKQGLEAVSSKRIIAFVNIMPNIAYTMKTNIFTDIKLAGYLKPDIKLSILINKNVRALLPILNKTIDTITEEERINIFSKWIDIKFEQKVDYKYFWQIVTFLFILVVVAVIIGIYFKNKAKKEIEKNKQQQFVMLQQSRLAQMGEMISMIAHQWRQPLNSLSMLNQSIVRKYEKDTLTDENVAYFKTNSRKQIQIMSKTIDDFRDFFKPEKEKSYFIINDVILDILDMINPIYSKFNINIEFNPSKEYKLYAYSNELGQAILNILNNAKDALIENKIPNKKITIEIFEYDSSITLMIEDNAKGIPDDIMDKIFDPYFSTKGAKNGTGLGLYMTKIIIEEHILGKLKVSNSSNGAKFEIEFSNGDNV